MKLKYVSITGADDNVDVADLNDVAQKYPFVECAILLMPEAMGQPRFPSTAWIRNFAAQYKGAHKAMHLCGSAFLRFTKDDPEILSLMNGFNRIQLNLKFGDVAGKYDPAALVTQVKNHPEFEFIIQYGKGHEGLLPLLKDIPNHAILFDESAGKGISPDRWPAPLSGHFCGYAGGLAPDNLAQHLALIEKAAGERETWIDMESGVRTNDHFDLEKVNKIMAIVTSYPFS